MSFTPPPPGQPFDASRVTTVTALMGAILAKLVPGVSEEVHRDTPDRYVRMMHELLSGYREDPVSHLSRQFYAGELGTQDQPLPSDQPPGIVVQRGIPFYSLCEHHLLPFHGHVHLAYLPTAYTAVGLSKLARMVFGYARRLQMQERLTMQIADALMLGLRAEGAMVIVQAEHLCMTMRGVRAPGTTTTTSAVRGVFFRNPTARSEAATLLLQRSTS